MSSPLRALLLSLALAALPAAIAGEARADEASAKADEASAHFKRGVAFYKDKDYPPALVEFKRAYELVPNYSVLFNLGQTARELKDYAAALSAFEQYLRDGGAKISGARRKEVTAAVDELRTKVGKLKITVNVDGAEIGVDDVAVGVAPLAAPIVVNAGRRKLSVRSSGYAPLVRVVEVPSTEETPVTLELVKPEADKPRTEGPPPPPPPKPGPSVVAWALLGTTGALAIATAVTGGLAVSAHATLKSDLSAFPGNPQAIGDAQSKTKTLANATDALIGVTAAAAVATGVFFFVVPRLGEKKTAVGVSPTGVAVRGAF